MLDKNDILNRIDVLAYYSQYVKFEDNHGKNRKALCPFHAEESGSFYVEISTGRWYCQGACGTGGDLIAFHMRIKGLSFKDALRDLAAYTGVGDADIEEQEDQGIDIGQEAISIIEEINETESGEQGRKNKHDDTPHDSSANNEQNKTVFDSEDWSKYRESDQQKKTKRKRSKIPDLNEEEIEKFHNELSQESREYLNSRCISDEVINSLKIGEWSGIYGKCIVFPVRNKNSLWNLRFYRRATDREPKQIRQLSSEKLGHDPIWLFPEPRDEDSIYLFEGEPDCLCALSLGLNASTVTGGAGTFREEFLPYFKDKKVFICYDVDQKGRIGAKLVAKQIARVAKETRIVKLDLDPEKYPKGDFNDYISKENKTKENFLALCDVATPSVSVPAHVSIDEEDGRYYKINEKNGEVEQKDISNFVIRLVCRLLDSDGDVSREVELVSDTGKRSGSKILEAEQMSSLVKFRTFCFGCGDYMFKGSEADLNDIWYLVSAQDLTSKIVKQVPMAGYFVNDDIWMFKNMAVKKGEIIHPDNHGICWNGTVGYTHIPIELIGKDYMSKNIPSLLIDSKHKNTFREFNDVLVRNIGNPHASLALSLVVGASHYNDLVRKNIIGCFPIIFVYGALKSGKTELVSLLMHMWGLGKEDADSLPAITSTVPISRKLAYNSCIPSWWDEYRENMVQKNGILGAFRNAYDGVGRTLGAKERGIHYEPVRGPVIISGEHIPSDEALRSRFIPIRMFPQGKNVDLYPEVIRLSHGVSFALFEIIKERNSESVEKLISKILDYKDKISSGCERIDERTSKNYAIALGCYSHFINPDDEILPDMIINGGGINYMDAEEVDSDDPYRTQVMDDFIDEVQSIIESKKINNSVSWYDLDVSSRKIYIWLTPIYDEYAIRKRMSSGQNPTDQRTILNHFKDMRCYLDCNYQKKLRPRGDSKSSVNKRCIVLSLDKIPKKLLGWFSDDMYYEMAMKIAEGKE
jgi:hypothetical protein